MESLGLARCLADRLCDGMGMAEKERSVMRHKHSWVEIAGEGSWTGYGCKCGMVLEVDHIDGSQEVRDKPVVLQGIGVPDRGGLTRSRILIVMKEAGRRVTDSN